MTICKNTNISQDSFKGKSLEDEAFVSLDINAILMSKISKTKCLTKKQEIALSKRILSGKSYEKLLLKLKDQNNEVPSERLEFIKRRIALGKKSVKQLTEANLRLVVYFANKFNNEHVDVMDLYQEGFISLYKAAASFNWSYGIKFSTYASYSIRQSFQRFYDKQGRNIPIPIHKSEKIRKMKRIQQEAQQDQMCKLSNNELANRMNVSEVKIQDMQQISNRECSLEALADRESESSSYNVTYEHYSSPENRLINKNQIFLLLNVLNKLNNKEKYILKNYYGICMDKRKTLSEIGQELNISYESVRRIKENCIESIKNQLANVNVEVW